MSLGHGASIVRNGLVLHLDAANKKSYPGSGIVYKDLSGKVNDGTLANGPLFNSSGYLEFDGIDDHIVTSNYPLTSTSISNISMFAWVYPTALGRSVINYGEYSDSQYATGLGITSAGYVAWTANGNPTDGGAGYSSNISVVTNKWHYIGFIRTTTDLTLCANSSTATIIPSYSGGPIIVTNPFTIGMGATNGSRGWNFNGSIGAVYVYNRALSAAEVKQNFEALRGRYGI